MPAPPVLPPRATWLPLVEWALAEDIGPGDVTSLVAVGADDDGAARIEARESLVSCGLPVAEEVFRRVDPRLCFEPRVREGERVPAGEVLARVRGPLRALLAGERSALNFLGRLAGIASTTARYCEAVAGTGVAIVDTRKTLPGWRSLDKYAVAVGGGTNHRMGLYDGILLKDNHVAAAGGVGAATKAALARAPAHIRVQVEVEDEAQAREAVEAGAGFLLLDNLSPEQIAPIARSLRDRAVLEASGGVTLEKVRAFAEAGVHRVSIGALTHSVRCPDLALELELEPAG